MTAENNNEKIPEGHAKPFKYKKPVIVISIILAVLIGLASAFLIFLKIGENSLRNKGDNNSASLPAVDNESIPEDADAYYNGVAYNYNDKLINILLLGVDIEKPNSSDRHQADALYLISLDTEGKKVRVIPISRNTVVDVDVYGIKGDYIGVQKQQICLAYTYGNNDVKSSENTVNAVSRLFYGVPISGYYTIFMNSIKDIVNAVGGVPVTINEDLTSIAPYMKAGASFTVKGDTALRFLQYRSGTAAQRLERQKVFVTGFVTSAKNACLKDLTLPAKMYKKLASNTVTNVSSASAVYLASEAIEAEFEMRNIEGTVGHDGTYETFDTDENQLYQLLLDIFYKKQ